MNSDLSVEQKEFLEECEIEYVDRFSDADYGYKLIYDNGIPSPPIMFPWYNRGRYSNDKPGGSRNDHFSSRNRYNDSGHHERHGYGYGKRSRPF